jgi:hypothetical protein
MGQKYGILRRKRNNIGSGNGPLETIGKSMKERQNPKLGLLFAGRVNETN